MMTHKTLKLSGTELRLLLAGLDELYRSGEYDYYDDGTALARLTNRIRTHVGALNYDARTREARANDRS